MGREDDWTIVKPETWRRHANPWSVWTRVATGLPVTLGGVWLAAENTPAGWGTLGLAVVWLWLNPRIFPPPASLNSWASRVTLGEQLWLARKKQPIPLHHSRWACFLAALGGLGFIVSVYGAWNHQWTPLLCGGITSWISKMWFCDRMVWLYEDMRKS